jgi:hypothetical protein
MLADYSPEDAAARRKVIPRPKGSIPGCIMLTPEPHRRSVREMQDENAAFHRRVKLYLKGQLNYEQVW